MLHYMNYNLEVLKLKAYHKVTLSDREPAHDAGKLAGTWIARMCNADVGRSLLGRGSVCDGAVHDIGKNRVRFTAFLQPSQLGGRLNRGAV